MWKEVEVVCLRKYATIYLEEHGKDTNISDRIANGLRFEYGISRNLITQINK